MGIQKLLAVVTVANFALLLGLLAQAILPAVAAQDKDVLRGRALEIVDDQGRVRASLNIQPPANGQTETVLLRLINPAGQPSAKIAASATGSGLSFVGGDDESYMMLQAEGAETSLKMVEPGGHQQTLAP